MGILKKLKMQLSETKRIYDDCYTNDKNIYDVMPVDSSIEVTRRNYLAHRLSAQRAVKSQIYDEETIKKASGSIRNMIRIAAQNAPWYTPDIDIGEILNEDNYRQTLFNQTIKHMDISSAIEEYREYYNGKDGWVMDSVEGLYIDCGKEIIDRISMNSTVSEPNTYVNKKVLEQLRYVTDCLEIKDIQTLYNKSVKKLICSLEDKKYTHMIKGILQEYFKEILLDKGEVVDEYFKEFDKQIAEGKEKDEIPAIGDVIIGKYFEDTDYTKELDENREEFVEDLDKLKKEHSKDEKMLQVKPKGGITFASIKKVISKFFEKNEKDK